MPGSNQHLDLGSSLGSPKTTLPMMETKPGWKRSEFSSNSMCPCLWIFWDWWETWMVFPRHPMGILWPYGFPKPTIPHPSCSPNVPWPAVVAQHPPQPAPRSRQVAADPSGCCWRAGSGAPPGVSAASYPAGWPHSTAAAGSGAPPPRRRSPELCRKRATWEGNFDPHDANFRDRQDMMFHPRNGMMIPRDFHSFSGGLKPPASCAGWFINPSEGGSKQAYPSFGGMNPDSPTTSYRVYLDPPSTRFSILN